MSWVIKEPTPQDFNKNLHTKEELSRLAFFHRLVEKGMSSDFPNEQDKNYRDSRRPALLPS